jgi:hypothetical protein
LAILCLVFYIFQTKFHDMKKLPVLFALTMAAASLFAQQPVKKYVLIEHFTNSRCGVCASRNPAFFSLIEQPQNASELHHLAVHPSFPYSSCVFYQANTADNTALVNRYSIFGTPTVVLNGTVNPSGASLLTQGTLNTYFNQTSPLHVKVTENNTGATRTVNISARTVGSVPSGQYKLYVVLAEKTINLTTPNGEKVHHNVMRDLLSDAAFTPAALGSTVDLNLSYTPNAAWNASELYILAFIQNTVTKEIINSGTRFDPAVSGTREVAPQQVSIQPNPAQDLAYAQVGEGDAVKQVEMFSVSGQRTVLSFQEQQGQVELPVAALAPGVYFVKMTGEKGVYVGKLVKQ